MAKNKREYKKSNDPNNLGHIIKRPTYVKEVQMDSKDEFKTKYGHDGRFVGFKNINEFIKELPDEALNIYNELIPVKGFIPLYMDVDYYTTEPNRKPLNALLELLYHFCKMNFNDYFKLEGVNMEDWKDYFLISTASRHDKHKNMYKNSYHLKLMGDWDTCIDYDTVDKSEDYIDDTKIPYPYIHFESQSDIQTFLDNCINVWAANSTDETIKHLYEFIHICNDTEAEQKPLGIVDKQVYTSHLRENSQSFRMLYSCKEWFDMESQLIPISGKLDSDYERAYQILLYSITTEHSRNYDYEILASRSKKIPCAHLRGFQETRKDPDTIMNQTAYKLSSVPDEEEAAAKLLIQSRLGPTCIIVGSDVTYNNDYAFNIQSQDKCLVCKTTHPIEFSSYKPYNYKLYHTPNTNRYKLYCCKENKQGGQYKKLNPIPTGIITKWDYRHEDGEFLCVPFNEPRGNKRKLEKGGTFFYEGPKGSGKTQALVGSLEKIPKNKSVLVLTYRVNLSNTYKADFAKYNFTHYKDYHGTDNLGKANQNKHRYIVLLDSIKKTVEVAPEDQKSYQLTTNGVNNGFIFSNYVDKYDYVIIDEIYSVLEHWQSKLMGENKLYAMMLFEHHVKRCGKLICLDAHLNNSMVVNTINKMRNPDKFICYKNPNAYDMSDYKVYYREQLYTPNKKLATDVHGLTELSKYKDMIVKDLLQGKKLCVMSSTKAFVDEIKNEVLDKQKQGTLPQFAIKLYTSDTDKTEMKDDMENVFDVFADKTLKLLLYSPTISAGISYNSNIPEEGFDKLYCCVQTGANVCSLNTTKQMLRRIRQLVDKEIHILFNRQKDPFPLRLDQIEKVLYDQSNNIHKYLGKPELCSSNQLDACMKIKYDRNRWDYNVWKENAIHRIKYEKHSNFTQGLKQSLCNSPGDDIEPGYGMQWIDCTTPMKMTEEQVEHSIKQQKERNDLKAKADCELYNEYMNLPKYNEEEIEDLIARSRTGAAAKALDRTEEMIMKRYEIFRVYGLDIDKWKKEEDLKIKASLEKNWKQMLRFTNVHQFNRQLLLIRALQEFPEAPMYKITEEINRRALKHYHLALQNVDKLLGTGNSAKYTEKFSTMYDQLIGEDKKNLNTPQILEALYTQKLQQFPKCFEIMELLGVKPNEIKEGTAIKHADVAKLLKNKELVKKLHKDCYEQFPHLVGANFIRKPGVLEKSEINIRDALQKWQIAHPETHILSVKRDEVLHWLQTEGGLLDIYVASFNNSDGLKVADFDKVHKGGLVPDQKIGKGLTPSILREGKYFTSAMSASRWETCEVRKFLGIINHILEDTTGFKCNSLRTKQNKNDRHRPYEIKNNDLFKLLEKYRLEVDDPFAYCLLD